MLAHVDHDTKFATQGQQKLYIPVPYSNGQGIGPTNADAYTARSGAKGYQFEVPQRRIIHFGEITADVVRNAEAGGSEEQFVDALMYDIDGATENFGQEINQRLYGSALGTRALVHATTAISGTVLTLANPEDAQFFEIDMLVSVMNGSDDTLRDSGDYVTITAVDPIAGTLTADANWSNITGTTTGDKLVRRGFRAASIDGLDGWVPVTPVADFLGVNQTLYRTRLAGTYVDVSSSNIRQGVLRAISVARGQIGAKYNSKDPWFMNPADKMHFVQSVESVKVNDIQLKTKYNVGLEAVEILGARIVEDRHCPVGHAFQVPEGAFTFATAGAQPKIEEIDGKRFNYNRQTGYLEFTLAADCNAYSKAVNRLARMKLPTRPTF